MQFSVESLPMIDFVRYINRDGQAEVTVPFTDKRSVDNSHNQCFGIIDKRKYGVHQPFEAHYRMVY